MKPLKRSTRHHPRRRGTVAERGAPPAAMTLGAATVALAVAAPALAQGGSQKFTLEGGASFLASSASRSNTSGAGFHVGAGYELHTRPFLGQDRATPWIEVLFDESSGHGNHIDMGGLLYSEKIALSRDAVRPGHTGSVWYAGFGVGVFYLDGTGPAPAGTGGTGGGSNLGAALRRGRAAAGHVAESRWLGGGRLLLGADLPQHLYWEGAWNIVGGVAGMKAMDFNVSLGYRF